MGSFVPLSLLVGDNGTGKSRWARANAPGGAWLNHPEAHLHPRQQALEARVLASAARSALYPIVVETHSEVIVGEIGMAIARGHLECALVRVLCFYHDREPTEHRFNEDGVLRDWPVGFLSP